MALETKETQPLSLSDPRKHSDIFGRIRDETRPLAIFRFEGNFLIVYEGKQAPIIKIPPANIS